jgi:hypothetical protein
VQQREGRVHVTCIVTHERGHSETVTMDAPPDSSGKKNSIQQIASATTYLQRYTLLAATGMATKGMDDDGRGADDEGASDDPLLEGFRDAAMRGYAALRAHYEANVPTEEFWAKHSASLKECARRADQEKTK